MSNELYDKHLTHTFHPRRNMHFYLSTKHAHTDNIPCRFLCITKVPPWISIVYIHDTYVFKSAQDKCTRRVLVKHESDKIVYKSYPPPICV